MTKRKKTVEAMNTAAVQSGNTASRAKKKAGPTDVGTAPSHASVQLRLPAEVKSLAQMAAAKSRRSLNQYLIYLIEKDSRSAHNVSGDDI